MTSVLEVPALETSEDRLAVLVDRLRQEGEGLRSALRGTAALQQAIGIVMERYSADAREAFDRLLRVAAESQRTVPQVAEDLVAARTGRLSLTPGASVVSVTHPQGEDQRLLQAAFQQCAQALPMALTVQHVVDVVAGTGLAVLSPSAIAIYGRDSDEWLVRLAATPHDWMLEWPRVPVEDRVPMSAAGHHGGAVWLTEPSAREGRFAAFHVSDAPSVACLPMHRNGMVVGCLVIGWPQDVAPDESARRHALAVADLAAESMHRLSILEADDGRAAAASADPATALVEAGLHPTALLRPIHEAGGTVIDFEIEWVMTPEDDSALQSLAGSRMLERFPSLHDTAVEHLLREVISTGERRRVENIVIGGLLTGDHPIRISITATPFVDGLLVAWVNHDKEDQRLAVVTDELTVRREQAARDRQAIEVMQRSALPEDDLREVDGVDIVARYLPVLGDPLGGDWYDVFVHDERVWLAVGDVAGHGVAAAARMSQLRNAARGLIVSGANPAEICHTLNRLTLTFATLTTATCIIGVLDPAHGVWTWSNAGHPAPIVIRSDRPHHVLESPPGLLLGVTERADYGLASHQLSPGSTLLLMTDGMFERPGESVDVGIRRLLKDLPTGDVSAVGDRLAHALPVEHRDDACFLLARCHPRRVVA